MLHRCFFTPSHSISLCHFQSQEMNTMKVWCNLEACLVFYVLYDGTKEASLLFSYDLYIMMAQCNESMQVQTFDSFSNSKQTQVTVLFCTSCHSIFLSVWRPTIAFCQSHSGFFVHFVKIMWAIKFQICNDYLVLLHNISDMNVS